MCWDPTVQLQSSFRPGVEPTAAARTLWLQSTTRLDPTASLETSALTTLAQAFRWGLYDNEGLNSTNYTKKKDIILLNNEVINMHLFTIPPLLITFKPI